ncbi:hypothetical protein, partial [Cupriavidus sp. UGS-1]|uniref:hypothetical protein n=1 Tax=Cupriavidus sp. UGS-1 TaxID=2899826 RepID=UPI001E29715D
KVGPAADAAQAHAFGVLLQYPGVNGDVADYRAIADAVHAAGGQGQGRPQRRGGEPNGNVMPKAGKPSGPGRGRPRGGKR